MTQKNPDPHPRGLRDLSIFHRTAPRESSTRIIDIYHTTCTIVSNGLGGGTPATASTLVRRLLCVPCIL